MEELFKIPVEDASVTAIATTPANPVARILMAHGAGAGITHRFMDKAAMLLYDHGIAVVRFNFPYMESGRKRPDVQKKAVGQFKEVLDHVLQEDSVPWFIGGKSYGGRMASHVAAIHPEINIKGLVFWGFPLHAPGRPGIDRAAHLTDIVHPMLFLQGTRDTLADLTLLTPIVNALALAEMHVQEGADHSFHVLKRSGRSDDQVMESMHDEIARWINTRIND